MSTPIAVPGREKVRAASASIATNAALAALKVVGAILTGSVGLLSEAVHSGADLVGSTLVLASVRLAAMPPDDEHPYGHAKAENVAGLTEAAVLGVLGVYVVIQGAEHLVRQVPLQRVDVGLGIAGGCALVSGCVGVYIHRIGTRTHSAALRANGIHLLSDLATSAGVAFALFAVRFLGLSWADGVIGFLLGVWLAASAGRIGYDAFQQLIDRRLSDADVARIRLMIEEETSLISYHRLRTRLSGDVHYIDFHVVVPNTWSVVEAHQVVDRLERRLKQSLVPAVVVIHVDPYDEAKARRGKTG